jgi:hypothetical protein
MSEYESPLDVSCPICRVGPGSSCIKKAPGGEPRPAARPCPMRARYSLEAKERSRLMAVLKKEEA